MIRFDLKRHIALLPVIVCSLVLASCSPRAEIPPVGGTEQGDSPAVHGSPPMQTQTLNLPERSLPKTPGTDLPGDSTPEAPASENPAPEDPAPEEPSPTVPPEVPDETLVELSEYIPSILVELKYATEDNFTGQIIYDFENARLRYGTVKKLAEVQEELSELGLGLKIWDAYRPTAAQFALWEVCPDARYVANPINGFSSHSRGNTVDLTLVTADGEEVEMPSGFDDFSALADRDYSDVSETASANARLLEDVMTAHGFKPYSAEWWHYSDEESYPVFEED